MARPSTLRVKTVKGKSYWICKFRGTVKTFGRTDEVTEADARQRFVQWINLGGAIDAAKPNPIRLSELADLFVQWLVAHRSDRTAGERRNHLRRFLKFHDDCWVHTLRLRDLEAFLDTIQDPIWKRHHAVSIKAMIRWGRREHLSMDFNPFDGLDLPTPQNHLNESDLPTDAEVQALLKHADSELADLIGFYLATGARTGEAIKVLPTDFNPRSKTITLAEWKNSKKTGKVRVITLNDAAFAIIDRRVKGKSCTQAIFTTPSGRPWKMNNVSYFWGLLREKAGVREQITPYSLRHLWATDAIESGVDLATIAKMMGSSVAVVERYYGHLRQDASQDALRKIAELRFARA
jgi:integrase